MSVTVFRSPLVSLQKREFVLGRLCKPAKSSKNRLSTEAAYNLGNWKWSYRSQTEVYRFPGKGAAGGVVVAGGTVPINCPARSASFGSGSF